MALVFLIAVGALVLALTLRARLKDLETLSSQEIEALRSRITDLHKHIAKLGTRLTELEAAQGEGQAFAPLPPAPLPAAVAMQEVASPPELAPPPPPALAARPPSPPAAPPVSPAPPAPATQAFDWESLVGVKLFSWVAGIALVVAGLFFLRYSIEQGWLQPPVRMAIGIIVSIALLAVCELKAARAYPITANALDAAAVALLFSTFYAGYALWGLIGVTLAFTLLALIAAAAVILSIRRNSMFIALLGVAGGFATPALVSTGQDNPVGLFGYLLILCAALSVVAYRKSWPLLVGLSVAFTTIYQWSWTLAFLDAPRLLLAVGVFFAFPVLNVVALFLGRPRGQADSAPEWFASIAATSACLPLFFAYFLAASPVFAGHFVVVFVFLLALDAGLFALAITRGLELLHLVAGAATLVTLWMWINTSYGGAETIAAWPAILAFVAALVTFYLAAPWLARRFGKSLAAIGGHGVLIAPLLLSAFPMFASLERGATSPALLFGVLLVLLSATAWAAIAMRRAALHYVAALFALAAVAVWSARHLSPERLPAALVTYAILGLFYLAIPLVAKRADPDHETLPPGALFLGLAGHMFIWFVALAPSLSVPPWGLLTVLSVLDLAIGAAALHVRRGGLFLAALAASQAILMVWAPAARQAPWPAVAVLAGGALVALGCAWLPLVRRAGTKSRAFDAAAVSSAILAQVVTVIAAAQPGAPDIALIVAVHVALIVVVLTLAALRDRHTLAMAAAVVPAVAAFAWQAAHRGPAGWTSALTLALAAYLPFAGYPLALGSRARRRIEPYQAAVLASVPFLLIAHTAMTDGGLDAIIGVLPVFQAALLAVLLLQLLRLESPAERSRGRLVLVAGAVLAFVTLAIPLQLEKEWITIAWALEGAVLAWLFARIPHRGLFWSAVALLAIVFVRLALNPQVFVYQPRGSLRIWNWYLYTYLVAAAAMLATARLLARTDDATLEGLPRAGSLLKAGATILLFLLLNIEIADFFATGERITFNFTAALAQDLTYTLAWALFGVGLLAVGIVLRSHAARVSALGLLVVTILKCFLHDLGRLGGLYRVGSFVGLAICLALVAVALQRFVLAKPRGAAH